MKKNVSYSGEFHTTRYRVYRSPAAKMRYFAPPIDATKHVYLAELYHDAVRLFSETKTKNHLPVYKNIAI